MPSLRPFASCDLLTPPDPPRADTSEWPRIDFKLQHVFGECMEPGSAWYKCLNNDDRVLDFFHAVLRLASDNVIEDVEKARPLMRLLFRADEKPS